MILRAFRVMEGMTQGKLAERLGIARTRLSEMERGKRPVSTELAGRLAEIFGAPRHTFMINGDSQPLEPLARCRQEPVGQ